MAHPDQLVDWRLALAHQAAVSLGLLTSWPATGPEVAARCGLEPAAVAAVLELHVAHGLLVRDDQGRLRPGPAALDEEASDALVQHGVWIQRWSALLEPRLRDRGAQSSLAPSRPLLGQGLQRLAAATRGAVVPVVTACLDGLPPRARVLDVGGGHGQYALELARRGALVVMQDLPAVIEVARERADLTIPGVELFAGDAFDELPPGPFDVVLCATVTNMFNEERASLLIDRLASLVGQEGRLVIVSYLRDHGVVGAAFGLQMLVATAGGDAHGEAEYRRWLTAAGLPTLEVSRVEDPALSLVIGRR